jgi:hypothetical protein
MMIWRLTVAALVVGAVCVSACRSTGPVANSPGSPTTSSPVAGPSAPVVKSKIDICNLLTSDDLKVTQGEAFKDAQRSDRLDGDFVVAQCYYAMPTTVNSVVVNVTTAKDEAGSPNPKAFWEKTFGGDEEQQREGKGEREREKEKARERAREKEKPKEREREEEGEGKEGSPPQRVKNLADEAFWVGSPVGGALYVLKNDLFFRISIGGGGDQKSKLAKSRTLAEKILKQLS